MTSSLTFSTTAADTWGTTSGINNSDTAFPFGTNAGVSAKVWIPFVVNLPRTVSISAATLRIVGSATRTETIAVRIGCEAADNASAPADWTALNAKSMSSAYTDTDIATNVNAGTEYSVDVTTAVQEIIARSGWAYGNTLAILVHNNGTPSGDFHGFASFDNVSYAEPKLDITFQTYIPQSGGMF